ncbi:hypothetical protein TVAG_296320 [Trichomonas vaginalis G3]|uniref:MYCBP-associated protein n=1 Tax=Trichomonas vaginalis (strain ATCC PRA-98 / G3) TaxID=412133 RepID=A2F780_TRIV3|nr:EPSIN/ENT-related family [Trichomonas vaginalis G3]EAX99247.1 hypothetical protein TVAG_296320 [Trichomonas vaginalis G3]KAI5547934.1 EPSIN/ENT-related family [Trichomonas vaginalis G3]|eukprot:XP_001312177.1 hypothetical protein [Trichomonas vaginalis G3]
MSMMKPQINRKKKLVEFRPHEKTREENAMKLHEETQKKWDQIANNLAKKIGRDPTTLAMNSDDMFRRTNEERFLIAQVINALSTKDAGVWKLNPRIGDLYAQVEKPNLANFESIGNPESVDAAKGARPFSWFSSPYYKKLSKQLKSHIEKIKPFEPNFSRLVVVGRPINEEIFEKLPEVQGDTEIIVEEHHEQSEEVKSVVKANIDTNRLFFRATPGVTQAKTVEVTNEGTSAIYYKWELAHDIDLMIGSGSNRTPLRKPVSPNNDVTDNFDWRISDSFIMPKDMQPKTRSEFLFTQIRGSILPGKSMTFSFSFKSDIPGCFTQRWVMRTTPAAESDSPLTIHLRGCCEVDPPDLTSFRKSIDESLHESERTRCVEEILASVFERVEQITQSRNVKTEEQIEGDLLVDDRAPKFDSANSVWGVKYSPALYESLLAVAEESWDALGITGFERFWDYSLTSLTKLIMKVQDGEKKRHLLSKVNEIVRMNMTQSAAGSLSYSIAYVQLSTMFEDLPDIFNHEASIRDIKLNPFVAPKQAENANEDELESTRRKHKRSVKETKKPPPKKGSNKKGAKEEEQTHQQNSQLAMQKTITTADMPPELHAALVAAVKEQLKKKINVFEQLAGESSGVAKQLTRINEVDRLDTDLDAEVEEDDEI